MAAMREMRARHPSPRPHTPACAHFIIITCITVHTHAQVHLFPPARVADSVDGSKLLRGAMLLAEMRLKRAPPSAGGDAAAAT